MQQPQNSPWNTLSNQCLIPSASHAEGWLAPMFELFNDTDARLIEAGSENLLAVTGLKKMSLPGGLAIPIAQTWDAGFLFSGTPLLSQNNPQKALLGLLQNARQEMGAKAVLFRKVQRSKEFDTVVEQLSTSSIAGYKLFNAHERAGLKCVGDFQKWMVENFSRKRRKEYRRLRNRLTETGELQSLVWQPTDHLETWINEFIDLEAAGWKGRNGTAIACNKQQSAHLRHSLPKMAQNGSLLFWKITLDGKTIASMFGFQEENQVWLGKMAFNETLSQFSPGVLIILDATQDLFARQDVTLADSSADPNHPMIDNIWRDRIPVADYLIATPGTSGPTFKALVAFEKNRLKIRNLAKQAYYKLREGKKK